jgi:hypothetical protein
MNKQCVFVAKPSITLSGTELLQIEQTLAENLKGLASELRLTEVADFVTFIRIGQMANLRNIVQSSAELHFEAGTLELTELGEAECVWTGPPTIILVMKFDHDGISIYFKLRLAAVQAAVEVLSVKANLGIEAPAELHRLLRLALQRAGLKSKPGPEQSTHHVPPGKPEAQAEAGLPNP